MDFFAKKKNSGTAAAEGLLSCWNTFCCLPLYVVGIYINSLMGNMFYEHENMSHDGRKLKLEIV